MASLLGTQVASFHLVQSSKFSVMNGYLILYIPNLSPHRNWMKKENIDASRLGPDNPFHFYSLVCLLFESVAFVFKDSEH